jgi:penicillin amidase
LRQAAARIAGWDGRLTESAASGFYDGPGVPLFRAWLAHALERLLKADLPADVYAKYAATGYLPALSPLSAKPGSGAKQLWYALRRGRMARLSPMTSCMAAMRRPWCVTLCAMR